MSDVTEIEPYWGLAGYANQILKNWSLTDSAKGGWEMKLSNPAKQSHGTAYGLSVRFEKPRDPKTNSGWTAHSFIFVLDMYPACCAFKQLNHFSYGAGVTEANVHALLNDFFQTLNNSYERVRKVVLNVVERQYAYDTKRGRNLEDSLLGESEHSGDFYYPFVNSWAKKQKGCIDTPLVNHNTSRIIHHMIVFPDVTNV